MHVRHGYKRQSMYGRPAGHNSYGRDAGSASRQEQDTMEGTPSDGRRDTGITTRPANRLRASNAHAVQRAASCPPHTTPGQTASGECAPTRSNSSTVASEPPSRSTSSSHPPARRTQVPTSTSRRGSPRPPPRWSSTRPQPVPAKTEAATCANEPAWTPLSSL